MNFPVNEANLPKWVEKAIDRNNGVYRNLQGGGGEAGEFEAVGHGDPKEREWRSLSKTVCNIDLEGGLGNSVGNGISLKKDNGKRGTTGFRGLSGAALAP